MGNPRAIDDSNIKVSCKMGFILASTPARKHVSEANQMRAFEPTRPHIIYHIEALDIVYAPQNDVLYVSCMHTMNNFLI